MDINYFDIDARSPMKVGDQWFDNYDEQWKPVPPWWIGKNRLEPNRTSYRVRRPRSPWIPAIMSAARFVGVVWAIIGWTWFASLLFVKYSGAAIYATTEAEDIRDIDQVFRDRPFRDPGEVSTGFRFRVKIGGDDGKK